MELSMEGVYFNLKILSDHIADEIEGLEHDRPYGSLTTFEMLIIR